MVIVSEISPGSIVCGSVVNTICVIWAWEISGMADKNKKAKKILGNLFISLSLRRIVLGLQTNHHLPKRFAVQPFHPFPIPLTLPVPQQFPHLAVEPPSWVWDRRRFERFFAVER